jgi:hypothetical protein
VIDPGFYDWSDSGNGSYEQSAELSNNPPYAQADSSYAGNGAAYAAPMPYPAPYTGVPAVTGSAAYNAQAATTGDGEQPLTLIFKDGRSPQTIQNYIMSAKALTDLDRQHYQQIPLDQIDLAATEKFNRTRGIDFEVPGGGRWVGRFRDRRALRSQNFCSQPRAEWPSDFGRSKTPSQLL